MIEPSPVPGKVSGFPLGPGDIVRIESSGGGGAGDPLERALARVAEDIAEGYLTADQAEIRYGLVLDEDGAIDPAPSEAKRQALREARRIVRLAPANEEIFEGARRIFRLAPSLAGELGVEAGGLVELTGGRGAVLRGWVEIAEGQEADAVHLGPSGLGMIQARADGRVEVRKVVPLL